MSVWLEIPRRRPDGRHKAFERTFVRSAFQVLQKFFPELSRVRIVLPCCPDGRTLATCNFHIKARCVRTMTSIIQTVNLVHAISIYEARAFRPWRPSSRRLNSQCLILQQSPPLSPQLSIPFQSHYSLMAACWYRIRIEFLFLFLFYFIF
jgi:hypothetical protein